MARHPLPGRYCITIEKLVVAPSEHAWAVIADFSAVDTLAPSVTRSYALEGPAEGLGARRHCDIKGFGSIDEKVIEWIDGRALSYDVTPLGPLGASINRWTVVPEREGARRVVVELGYDVRFGLLGWLMHALMMRRKLEKAFAQSLEAFSRRVETGATIRPRRARIGRPQLIESAA